MYFPPLSAAHHEVVGPRAVFATPLAPTGTLLVASMATVNYRLAVGVAGRCMGRFGEVRQPDARIYCVHADRCTAQARKRDCP